jgi:hypothetical protein
MYLELSNPIRLSTSADGIHRVESDPPLAGNPLTREEAATFLSLSLRSFDTLRRTEKRKLPYRLMGGRLWFNQDDLQKWMFGNDL